MALLMYQHMSWEPESEKKISGSHIYKVVFLYTWHDSEDLLFVANIDSDSEIEGFDRCTALPRAER